MRFVVVSWTAFDRSSAQAKSNSPLKANELELTFVSDDKTLDSALANSWNTFCKKFATQFLIGKGPQGRGIFKKKVCRASSEKTEEKSVTNWRLVFMSAENKVNVEGYYKNIPMFNLNFPPILNSNRLFSSPGAMQFAVAQVYRNLPVAWKVSLPICSTQ